VSCRKLQRNFEQGRAGEEEEEEEDEEKAEEAMDCCLRSCGNERISKPKRRIER
jgi:hypothetical protein